MANRIVINEQEISGTSLLGGKVEASHAMVGETLAADQFNFEITTYDEPFVAADQDHALITADNRLYFAKNPIDVAAFEDGTEIFWYIDQELNGKYFFEEAVQTGANRYKIMATSIIGRLLDSKHYGGIYSQASAADVYAEILAGLTYTIDPDVSAATVTGYLPIATRRDNLQQLLAVTGATIQIDNNGTIYIMPMSNIAISTFAEKRCYQEGKLTVGKVVHGVKLTEHNYFEAQNVVELFSDGVFGEQLIEFGEPYHDLTIDGGTILESGVNYARISAEGSVLLTGRPYTHVTRIVSAGVVDGVSTESVKSVSDLYLANPQIAQAIAQRFYEYLQCNKTITQDVLTGTERAGDVVSVVNPYTKEMETATITRLNVAMSGVNKASAEFLVGFVPQGVLSGFTNHALLTGSGSWEVPEGVSKIRIILVGAGSGGGGGYDGEAGSVGEENYSDGVSGAGGAGGKCGKAGSGGKVFEISMDVSPGQTFVFECGVGGIGGAGGGEEGAAGTPTTFDDGVYSSDFGRQYPYGYYETKTDLTMAAVGEDGFDGGAGGAGLGSPKGEYFDDENKVYIAYHGEEGESVNGFVGGLGEPYKKSHRYGGGGGGAANGDSGGNAPGYGDIFYDGSGGKGANAAPGTDASNYGQGGGAGNGGGGGGGGGESPSGEASHELTYTFHAGGKGGRGGKGGNGGPGAIIIYY